MDINQAAVEVEGLVTTFADASGKKAREVRVHPSGDDFDHIKVWVDLGPGVDDHACASWATAFEQVVTAAVTGYKIEVRAESL